MFFKKCHIASAFFEKIIFLWNLIVSVGAVLGIEEAECRQLLKLFSRFLEKSQEKAINKNKFAK
jgi:hypothetical protein